MCSEPALAAALFTRVPGTSAQNSLLQPVAQHAMCLRPPRTRLRTIVLISALGQPIDRQLGGLAHAHNARQVFRSCPPPALMPSTQQHRTQQCCRAAQTAHPLPAARASCAPQWSADRIRSAPHRSPPSPPPAPRRCGNTRPASRAILPISSTGCSAPVSLFAIITEISFVSGRSAARTSSGRTTPSRRSQHSSPPRPSLPAACRSSAPHGVQSSS